MSNFHALEVVGRGSETQLQAGEHFNYIINSFTTAARYYVLIAVACST